jgi:P27 family predicted phage terminase small subunit
MPAPRKSDEDHFLTGTTPHDRTSDSSHVPAGRPRFPKDLQKSMRPVFKRICSLLQKRRALTEGDVELIRVYCFQFDRHTRNAALLIEEGELVTYFRLDSNGQSVPQVKTNLRLKICTDAERMMTAILNQLGMTPTAKDRSKPTTANPEEEAPLPGTIGYLRPELFGGKK